jgi:hypothetical protein
MTTKLYRAFTEPKPFISPNEVTGKSETRDITLFDFSKPIIVDKTAYDAVIKPDVQAIPITYTFSNKNSKYNFLGVVHDGSIEAEAIVNAQNVDGASRLVIVPQNSDIEDIKAQLSEISEFDPSKWEIVKANDV